MNIHIYLNKKILHPTFYKDMLEAYKYYKSCIQSSMRSGNKISIIETNNLIAPHTHTIMRYCYENLIPYYALKSYKRLQNPNMHISSYFVLVPEFPIQKHIIMSCGNLNIFKQKIVFRKNI